MGTSAHVVVLGPSAEAASELMAIGRASIERLERSWSRFLPDSDVSRINRSPAVPVRVAPHTIDLVSRAIDGWARTGGVFDPTVGGSLRAAGYDRPFDELPSHPPGSTRPAPTPSAVVVHPIAATVTVPHGVELDLGGIGKGAAADLTVATLLDAGAEGAMVNLGGDLRTGGSPPIGGWRVTLECPGSRQQREIGIGTGAVCTSSTVKRRWRTRTGDRHHIIDPTTGRSSNTEIVSASVVGATATQCEVLATTAIGLDLAGARRLIDSHGACGVLVDRHGWIHDAGPIGGFR